LVGAEMVTIKRFEGLECGKALRELTNKTNETAIGLMVSNSECETQNPNTIYRF
jgi:hypothetical protein